MRQKKPNSRQKVIFAPKRHFRAIFADEKGKNLCFILSIQVWKISSEALTIQRLRGDFSYKRTFYALIQKLG